MHVLVEAILVHVLILLWTKVQSTKYLYGRVNFYSETGCPKDNEGRFDIADGLYSKAATVGMLTILHLASSRTEFDGRSTAVYYHVPQSFKASSEHLLEASPKSLPRTSLSLRTRLRSTLIDSTQALTIRHRPVESARVPIANLRTERTRQADPATQSFETLIASRNQLPKRVWKGRKRLRRQNPRTRSRRAI
jgi:hypothetical protein